MSNTWKSLNLNSFAVSPETRLRQACSLTKSGKWNFIKSNLGAVLTFSRKKTRPFHVLGLRFWHDECACVDHMFTILL